MKVGELGLVSKTNELGLGINSFFFQRKQRKQRKQKKTKKSLYPFLSVLSSSSSKQETRNKKHHDHNHNPTFLAMHTNMHPDHTPESFGQSTLGAILFDESKSNVKRPWGKLSNTIRWGKIEQFLEASPEWVAEDHGRIKEVLRRAMENNNLKKQSEVAYDVESGKIVKIPVLFCVEDTREGRPHRRYTIRQPLASSSSSSSSAPKKKSKKNNS